MTETIHIELINCDPDLQMRNMTDVGKRPQTLSVCRKP